MQLGKLYVALNFLALSACGGGDGGTPIQASAQIPATVSPLASAKYHDLQAAGLDVFASRHAEAETFISALPRGAMTYKGLAAFTTQAQAPDAVATIALGTTADVSSAFFSGIPGDDTTNPNSIATIEVAVDFAGKTASGTIANIQHEDGYLIDGSLAIKNGVLTGNELAATFVGNVNEEGNQQLWAGDVKGIFVGSTAQGLYGDFLNATTPSGGLYGGFVMETE